MGAAVFQIEKEAYVQISPQSLQFVERTQKKQKNSVKPCFSFYLILANDCSRLFQNAGNVQKFETHRERERERDRHRQTHTKRQTDI